MATRRTRMPINFDEKIYWKDDSQYFIVENVDYESRGDTRVIEFSIDDKGIEYIETIFETSKKFAERHIDREYGILVRIPEG